MNRWRGTHPAYQELNTMHGVKKDSYISQYDTLRWPLGWTFVAKEPVFELFFWGHSIRCDLVCVAGLAIHSAVIIRVNIRRSLRSSVTHRYS